MHNILKKQSYLCVFSIVKQAEQVFHMWLIKLWTACHTCISVYQQKLLKTLILGANVQRLHFRNTWEWFVYWTELSCTGGDKCPLLIAGFFSLPRKIYWLNSYQTSTTRWIKPINIADDTPRLTLALTIIIGLSKYKKVLITILMNLTWYLKQKFRSQECKLV